MNPFLAPLAAGFKMGVELRRLAYRRGWLKAEHLSRPVVSVGNLSLGGTGKTPLVALIAEILLRHGWKPGILTQGYGRRRGAEVVAIEPEAERAPDPREVGDEPTVLARKLPSVPIVVGTNRHRAGCLAEQRFNVDVHILDDGFQHLALARDVDIVALDVTQDFSDRALLPAGYLREPCSALKWADLIVLTRTDHGSHEKLEACVRRINPRAAVFRSWMQLVKLVNISSGEDQSGTHLHGKPAGAFCGIGNPRAFFADLRKWGFSVAAQVAFRDHHVYREIDLKRLVERARAEGVAALLTTEKDAVNFPRVWKAEIPILACVIRPEIREAETFEQALLARLEIRREKN